MLPLLHPPRHPVRLARFGIRAAMPATAAGAHSRQRGGAGAVRRRRRALVQPPDRSLQRRGRDGADLRLPPLWLAGRARRVAGDRRRAGGGACARAAARSRPGGRFGRLASCRPPTRSSSTSPRRRWRRSPAAGSRPGPLAASAATATAPARSRSTSRSRAGCRGAAESARRAGTVHAIGSYEELVAAEREVNRGRMPERPFVLVGQQYLADPGRSDGDVHPVWSYCHVPSGYRGDVDRGDRRPDRTVRPGAARADRRPPRPLPRRPRGLQRQLRRRRHHHRRDQRHPGAAAAAARARPLLGRRPWPLHLLGRDAARRRRPRDVRVQRRPRGPPRSQGLTILNRAYFVFDLRPPVSVATSVAR